MKIKQEQVLWEDEMYTPFELRKINDNFYFYPTSVINLTSLSQTVLIYIIKKNQRVVIMVFYSLRKDKLKNLPDR
jgi:hypothetical protein